MPSFSNEIIIGGQPYEIGGEIQVINFRDNLDYSFIDPVGGSCAPEGGGGGGGSGPTIPGLTVQTTDESAGRRRHSWRRGLSDRAMQSMSHEQIVEQLGAQLKTAVIHHDATYTAHHCFTVLCRRGLSTHFMVNHDGGIIQGLDPVYTAYHAGDFNSTSIGVDMNNLATVEGHQNRYSDPAFGGVADYETRETIEGRINRSRKTSFVYTEPQYVSLCALLRLIHEVTGMPLIYPMSDTGGVVLSRLTDPQNFIGFFGHWHCQAGKWDPGPGFDWERVMEGLHGKSNHWPVDLGTASLRDLRSSDAVAQAGDTFFSNIEQGPAGGAYPVGLNQEWHDGVHIYADAGTEIRACAEGEIILTRNGPDLPLGSPNYVLMRHKIDRERVEYDAAGEATLITDSIWWYSLYMHMQRMDPSEVRDRDREPEEGDEGEDTPRREMPNWFQRLVQRARESKAGPLDVNNDYDLEEVRINPRLFEERTRGLLRVQEFRHAYQCVEAGNPYRWIIDPLNEEESGIPVGGGDLLGYVGEYGELQGPRVEKNGLFQFQIFSTDPIFDDTRFDASIWRRLQGDLSGNSLVSVPELVLPIQGGTRAEIEEGGPRLDLGRGRVLTPSEIDRFFRDGSVLDRHAFRTVIAQHYSEWDIGSDDSVTANVQILWPWQTDEQFLLWRALHIGYKWLNDDTRDLLGMVEGIVPIYTYHPIYLLGWWTLNYGRSLQGQTFEGLQGAELEAALEAEADTEEYDRHMGETAEQSSVNIEEIVDDPIHYERLDGLDNGEWPPDIEFLHPLYRR